MASALPNDPKWPRAGQLLRTGLDRADVAILGIPAHATSLSPTNAHYTPAAVRNALLRYSTYSAEADLDLQQLTVRDAGDIDKPDSESGERRTSDTVRQLLETSPLSLLIGGDNSITFAGMRALAELHDRDWSKVGLITFDAHHDLRDGISNGSPVQRLIEAGLRGAQIVQIGIADFANSREYAIRARDYGITVIRRDQLRTLAPAAAIAQAAKHLGDRDIYVDVDMDVCDRAVVPGCPASVPGGLSADELRQLVRAAARLPRVRAIDFTEVDATADSEDQRTVRLTALCVLEAMTGFAMRKEVRR